MKTFTIVRERPAETLDGIEISENWLIMNAPRPLYSSQIEYVIRPRMKIGDDEYEPVIGFKYPEWEDWSEDGFIHGRFYAAVDPDDQKVIDQNLSLDAWVIEYITEDEWRRRVEEYRRKRAEQYGLSEEEAAEIEWRMWEDSYRNFLNTEFGKDER